MKTLVGAYQNEAVYLDSETDRDAIALIRHQQDTIEALRGVDADIAETMKLIRDREDG